MSYKDILIHLEHPAAAGPAVVAAAELARSHGAHLNGLFAYDLTWPLLSVGNSYLDPGTIQRLVDDAEAAAMKQADALRTIFEDVLRREALPGDWRQVEGSRENVVVVQARYADLSIFARSGEEDGETELAEEVLFASGRPILVLPPTVAKPFGLKQILIGWNGTREAARAVADAMPLLRQANVVRVLCVSSEARDDRESHINAEDLARHLARHGITVIVEAATADTWPVEDALAKTAAGTGSDLLVIGGYGHGRLREMVLGGVTRQLLRHAPLPVLLSH